MNKRTLIFGGIVILASVGTNIACSEFQDDRGIGDAPVEQEDDREVRVWPNGDGYPNIALVCAGQNGVYTNTRSGGQMEVVVNDPNCGGSGE